MTAVLPRLFHDREPSLTHAQRALVEWAKVDDNQAILDTACGSGALLNHFVNRYHLRACGIASNSADEAAARELLATQAEVYRASLYDIPWRDDTFHTAFVNGALLNPGHARLFVQELLRVLQPQGQVLAAMPCVMPLRRLYAKPASRSANTFLATPYGLMGLLEECGFVDISMRAYGLRTAVIAAHKSRVAVADARR